MVVLRRGQHVVDLGCWPGGWLQVAAQAVGDTGSVVGVDVAEMEDLGLANVRYVRADLSDPGTADAVLEVLGSLADVVLCDAAPKLTGVRATDRAHEEALLEAVEALLPQLLREGGSLVLKLLDAPEAHQVADRIRARFTHARTLRPHATRKGSPERYLLALAFRGN